MVRIKICGICNAADAELCARAGANALGFLCGVPNTVRSFISPAAARDIVRRIPPYISTVLVTTFSGRDEIEKLLREVPVSTVQLHGPIHADTVAELRLNHSHLKFIKVIQVVDREAVREAQLWEGRADALLLDSKGVGPIGGTGKTHDWNLSREIVQTVRAPMILAGGLSPDNVAQAVREVKPFGVDVNSGVTNQSLTKDPAKVTEFVRRALQALPGT